MFSQSFETRFSDTDALGHINNRMLPIWFEGARDPVFKIFMPTLDIHAWRLILDHPFLTAYVPLRSVDSS